MRIEDQDRVDRFARPLDHADVLQGPFDRPVGGHRDELGRHDRAGAFFRVDEELLQRGAGFRVEHLKEVGPRRILKSAKQISQPVGGHRRQEGCYAVARDRDDDLAEVVEARRVQHFDGALGWQRQKDRGRGFRTVLVEDIDDIGRPFIGQPRRQRRDIHGLFRRLWHFVHEHSPEIAFPIGPQLGFSRLNISSSSL